MKGVSGGAEATLAAFVEAGLSEMEMMSDGGYMSGNTGGGGRGGAGGGGGAGGRGGPGAAQVPQRPSRQQRMAAVEAFEKQVATLRTQIEKAPSVDPNVASLSGSALTAFMDVYAPESNTINEMARTLTTLSGVNVPAAGGRGGAAMGGMMGGSGGLTADTLTELLALAKQDNASKLTARLETISQQVVAAGGGRGGAAGAAGGRGGAGGGGRGGAAAAPLSEAELQTLRASRYVQLARAMDLRKMYNDAGVNIHFHKIGFGSTEEDYTWAANCAKAFGAIGMTSEKGNIEAARAVAPFAEKTGIWAVYHSHTNNYPTLEPEDPFYTVGKYVGYNFDIGHYVAGTQGKNPCEVIEKYHDKMVSIHLKDRTADSGNLEWGKGTTPIKEALLLIAKNKWPIYCDIELEYQYPGTSCIPEFKKCVDFCRNALA